MDRSRGEYNGPMNGRERRKSTMAVEAKEGEGAGDGENYEPGGLATGADDGNNEASGNSGRDDPMVANGDDHDEDDDHFDDDDDDDQGGGQLDYSSMAASLGDTAWSVLPDSEKSMYAPFPGGVPQFRREMVDELTREYAKRWSEILISRWNVDEDGPPALREVQERVRQRALAAARAAAPRDRARVLEENQPWRLRCQPHHYNIKTQAEMQANYHQDPTDQGRNRWFSPPPYMIAYSGPMERDEPAMELRQAAMRQQARATLCGTGMPAEFAEFLLNDEPILPAPVDEGKRARRARRSSSLEARTAELPESKLPGSKKRRKLTLKSSSRASDLDRDRDEDDEEDYGDTAAVAAAAEGLTYLGKGAKEDNRDAEDDGSALSLGDDEDSDDISDVYDGDKPFSDDDD